ncbi:MAG: heavy metal translocating P-type ATPase [Flavobacteriales bacterium]
MRENSTKKTIKVSGMSCANCAKGIENHLTKNGFEDVNVFFSNNEVSLSVNKKNTEELAISLINQIGFKASKEKIKEQNVKRLFYICLFFTIPLFAHMFFPSEHFLHNPNLQLILCIPVLVIAIYFFGKSAFNSLKTGVPNMDVLIIIGVVTSFFYSLTGTILYWDTVQAHSYLFFETSATITTLVLLGNLLEKKSVSKTTTAIKELAKLKKATCERILENGKTETVDAEKLKTNDLILINTGDKIPSDGIIIEGNGYIDQSLINGESTPQFKKVNEDVYGGTIIMDGSFKIKVTSDSNNSILSQIIELVKQAQNQKPPIQKLGDKVSAIFVPFVLFISLITFILSYYLFDIVLTDAIMRSIAVLVISCPCAMGLATPTAVMVGLGRAAKSGILIKGGDTLEQFARVKNIVFDKTGTLTNGKFILEKIETQNDLSQIKNIIFSLEHYSSHPLAKAIKKQLNECSLLELDDVKEKKGLGIQAIYDNETYQFGSAKYTNNKDQDFNLFLTKNGETIAKIKCSDQLKEDANKVIKQLKNIGMSTILLSGDTEKKCLEIAQKLNLNKWHSEQMPKEKLEKITEYSANQPTAMVGDGINDAPALSKADVGVSISNSTQIAMDSAQIILLDKFSLKPLTKAFLISKHTLITIKQNLFWAFSYNIVAIPIAALGYLEPMMAALFMAFSDIIVIGNSIRLKSKKLN